MKKRFALFLPALLFFTPLFFIKSQLPVLPNHGKYITSVYGDAKDSSGNSLCSLSVSSDSLIVFNYTLRKWNPSSGKTPYAGVVIDLVDMSRLVDISPYKYVCVDMVTKQSTSFEIQVKTFIKGFTKWDDFRTFDIVTKQVPVHFGSTSYKIPLNEFRIPDWLFRYWGPRAATLPQKAVDSMFFGINFQSGSAMNLLESPDEFSIRRIYFDKGDDWLWQFRLKCLGGFFAYIGTIVFILLYLDKIRRKREREPLIYKKIPIINPYDEDTRLLVDYIGAHFQDPEVNIEQIVRDTKIPPNHISALLQKKFEMGFRQHLNEVRITEAKRLLRDSELSVKEIADKVGYQNVTNFNRVFSKKEGISPTEYRDREKK